MYEAITSARMRELAVILREARSRLSSDDFADLHAGFVGSGPGDSQWTINLDDLNWYCASNGRWVLGMAPDAVSIDAGVLLLLEALPRPHAESRRPAADVVRLHGHSDIVNAVAVAPRGDVGLSAGEDGTVRLWDLAAACEITSMCGEHGAVFCAAFSTDGRHAFAGVWGAVCVWDLGERREVQRFGTPNEFVSSLAVSPDGRLLVSGGDERVVRIWEIATGREVATLPGFREAEVIQALAISPDGRIAMSGGIISGVRMWNLQTATELRRLGGAAVNSVAFSPDGREMAATGWSDNVVLYDPATGKEVGLLEGHADTVEVAAYSRDGRYIATGSHDRTVRIWDVGRRAEIARLEDHQEIVRSVAFTPDGRVLSGGGGLLTADFEAIPGSDFDLRLWTWRGT